MALTQNSHFLSEICVSLNQNNVGYARTSRTASSILLLKNDNCHNTFASKDLVTIVGYV